ncbi:MAG: O-antigen ligase family protein [Prevotella sp.]|nr:O-antigen ligase family protein [Prevotella sp.]
MKYTVVSYLLLGFLLWFTIQPVEMTLTETDLRLTEAVCGVAVISVLMLVWRRQQMALSAIDVVVFLWFLYVMLRAYVTPVYPCAYFCLRTLQMFLLYIAARLLFSSVNITERALVIGILLCAIYEVLVGVSQLWEGNSRHCLYALSGTFLNPGPYSAFLAMGVVMSCKLQRGYWLPALFAMLLPATWSRAALVSAAICIGIIYWDKWKQWKWQVTFGIIVVMAGLYFLKKGSADGRSIIYMISLLSILQHPLFGSGISSFCHQYAEGMSSFSSQHPTFDFHSADVTSSAYNSLLQIGVEQGLVGICIAVTLVTLILVRLNMKGKVLGIGLLCLLIFSMFSYPFDQLPYQIIFVVIAAYAATGEAESATSTRWSVFFHRSLAPVTLFSAIALFSIFTHHQMKERVKAESDYQMMVGVSHAAFIDDYYELLPLLSSNEHFLFDFAKILAADGRYNDSNAILRLGTLVSNDPMFYVIQGNNYNEMGFCQEAEKAYMKAFNIMPNRLYPLYQLMLLYEKEGDMEKMTKMAQQVIAFKEKITSPATKEMKKKANVIANHNKLNPK